MLPDAGASKHLWLGNLNTRLPRAVLKAVFEQHGPVDDVVTFPGRMYAFVNFQHAEDAARAQEALDGKEVTTHLLLLTLTACCLATLTCCCCMLPSNTYMLLPTLPACCLAAKFGEPGLIGAFAATVCILDNLLSNNMP